MLKEVDKEVWQEEIISQNVSVFDKPEYLETVSSLHGTQIKYWIIYKGKKAIIGFATHIKNQSIIIPDHFSYSSFWFDKQQVGDFSFFENLQQAISSLKTQYRFISFRLPPHMKDIRAFNSLGFTSSVNYTYLKQLNSQLRYRANIEAKLKESDKQNFVFVCDIHQPVLEQQLRDFRYFGFSKTKEKFYKSYFENLLQKGFLKSFAVYKDQELIASALVLLEKGKEKAYNLLLSSSKSNYSGGASTFLYHHIFLYLKNSNFEFMDLYGADMKGIANYKAGFNGQLENHYTVTFGFSNKYIKPGGIKMKKIIKSLIYR